MKKPSKSPYLTISRKRAIEIAAIALCLTLFVVLAYLNRNAFCAAKEADDRPLVAVSTLSVTEDEVRKSLEDAGFTPQADGSLLCLDGSLWRAAFDSDANGLRMIDLTVPLYPDDRSDSEIGKQLNAQNKAVKETLAALSETWLPLLGGSRTDADKLVSLCETAVRTARDRQFETDAFTVQIKPSASEGLLLRWVRKPEA